MISKTDVDNLAVLARIEIPDAEKEKLQKDLEAILGYISELTKATGEVSERTKGELINVFRADDSAHEAGIHTEAILADAPRTHEGYIAVRQIIEK